MESKSGAIGVLGHHDLGGGVGGVGEGEIDFEGGKNEAFAWWEKRTHALLAILMKKGYVNVHDFRRRIEALHPLTYQASTYYEKWAASLSAILVDSGVLKWEEVEEVVGGDEKKGGAAKFEVGDKVRVRREGFRTRWRKPHLRTPGYIFGCVGVVERYVGELQDPYFSSFGATEVKQHVYRVRFDSNDIWTPVGGDGGDAGFSVDVEILETWLEEVGEGEVEKGPGGIESLLVGEKKEEDKEHDHDHEHDHGHKHETRQEIECKALEKEEEEPPLKILSDGLIEILVKKGIFEAKELQAIASSMDDTGVAPLAKKMVARAWKDPEFKSLMCSEPAKAVQMVGEKESEAGNHYKLVVVENTPDVHNVIVCTLCSCYPTSILGMAPSWYKSRAYRARVVLEPRKVLEEFGLTLDKNVKIRVHDSASDLRYLVLPMKPEGADDLSLEELEQLVERDCLIGAALPLPVSSLKEKE